MNEVTLYNTLTTSWSYLRVLANELDDGVKYLDVLCFVFDYTTLTLFLSDCEDSFLETESLLHSGCLLSFNLVPLACKLTPVI